jgi:hypothetical protein
MRRFFASTSSNNNAARSVSDGSAGGESGEESSGRPAAPFRGFSSTTSQPQVTSRSAYVFEICHIEL